MKLIIQIPCLNEAQTLAIALADLPKSIAGIDTIEVLIIDDGSRDDTVAVARQNGVHHVVGFRHNQGLARAFMLGIESCLERGADIIVNTDADNQYNGADIEKLVRPILEGRADLVIGARPIENIAHFSPIKKLLQRLGSSVVRIVSGTDVTDAPSGFRAISREVALALNVFNAYTYTLETIIQAGQRNMTVTSVPIRVNGDLRPSRLVRSIPSYVQRSIVTMCRIFVVYKPLRFFMAVSLVPLCTGLAVAGRFLVYFAGGNGAGHVQSLILAAVLLIVGFLIFLLAIIADLLSVNRRLLEELQQKERRRAIAEKSAIHASSVVATPQRERALSTQPH
ncbi:MAG TPA: glycosyltransferase family 2 protein [Polyangiaceae bacterium]|jgi:glycosyltransferase involved in cell wall biosynthesis|nr:glycosyltransferase family 2 protein [Polyangiaceae bacterium]